MIDLSIFTKHPVRAAYSQPWSLRQHTYATDGRMAIRVPKRDDVPENRDMIGRANQIDYWLTNSAPMWFDVAPVAAPQEQQCPTCKGLKCIKICPECQGVTTVEASTSHNVYYCKCKNCKGKGYLPLPVDEAIGITCHDCDGDGTIYPDLREHERTKYGKPYFSNVLLSRLSAFSNVMIGPRGVLDFALLKFDEGDGLIMPMKDSKP